jgi:spermidine synthase
MNKPSNIQTSLTQKASVPILLVSVFIIAICGILYELLISSISSYFLGSSVLHFSLTIGLFLSFMGLGAYLSKFMSDKHLLDRFIMIEVWLGIIGGASGALLYVSYAVTENYYLIALLLLGSIGTLVGLEIPILTRIIRGYFNLKDTLAQVLSFDYLGALIASILFPLFLLPYLGLTRTSFFIGLLNLSVGVFNMLVFKKQLVNFKRKLGLTLLVTALYVVGFFSAFTISGYFEQFLYQDDIVFTTQSPYQRLVVTQWKDDTRLYIDGNLQFSSVDEYRYHEALVHVPLALAKKPESVLFLGAGDGLAIREILKHPNIKQIHVVDLDPEMTKLGKSNPVFKRLNKSAFYSPKVKVFNQDAFKFVEKEAKQLYSLIIIDLPDPNDVNVGKLYTREFYSLVKRRLAKDGAMVTQSTSPFFARKAYWCINQTLETVFPTVVPYTVNVPSFGQWGFNIAMNYPMAPKGKQFNKARLADYLNSRLFDEHPHLQGKLRYLTPEVVNSFMYFDKDMTKMPTQINTLNTQKLVQYYEEGWRNYNR